MRAAEVTAADITGAAGGLEPSRGARPKARRGARMRGRARSRAAVQQHLTFCRASARRTGVATDELLVDNFAGGGGASTGIELALGRSVDIAINHDRDAVEMHARNHPYTVHLCEDVWRVDPVAACAGRRVGVAWFSPDCKHFARARGCKPVDKKIRGLAWVAVRWARKVRPRLIFLENVPEFQTWSPVIPLVKDGVVQTHKDGSIKYVPDPKRKGQTFKRFVTTLRNLGYEVQWRVLKAADYGVPTTRPRFYLVARCDGRPIVWPKATHGRADSEGVLAGHLRPYRLAAECIDFNEPCPSIFERKKPLAENTLRRLALGLARYVVNNPDPFVVEVERPREKRKRRRGRVVLPYITRICQQGSKGANVSSVRAPLTTIVSKNEHCLITPVLVGVGGPSGSGKPRRADEPLGTVMPVNSRALVAAFLTKFYGTAVGSDLRQPMPTVTAGAGGGHMAEVRALLEKYTPGCVPAGEEPVTVMVRGERYVIADIGLRMLSPRELAHAQFGWAEDERTGEERSLAGDYELTGTQANQVAKIGNSVPPLVAAALVRANVMEMPGEEGMPLAA